MKRIVVIGGGPAGLSFAILAKAARPDLELTVFERNRADDTFGFGVVFSDATLDHLAQGDPVVHRTIDETAVHWQDISVTLRGEEIRCGGNGFSAFARKRLLAVLQQRALELGVDVRFSTPVDDYAALAGDADLVLAADGINSAVRGHFAAAFAPQVETSKAKFIWFGTTKPFDCLSFVYERDALGGVFGVHAYPYDATMHTFIVETDEGAWRAAGLDATAEGELDPVAGDRYAKAYCEEIFADLLDGRELVGNFSRWGNFRTVRNARWHHENVVLLGDAAHTAHFSVGSGTKMAMEDAIALAHAVGAHARLDDALAAYEAARKPRVEQIQTASWPSITWWEEIRRYVDFPLERFAFHFMSRSVALTRDRIAARDPGFVRRVEDWFARDGVPPQPPDPDRCVGLDLDAEAPLRVDVDAVAARGARWRAQGCLGAFVRARADRESRIRLALFADALRNGGGLPTYVDADVDDDYLRTLVLAGRADGRVPARH